MNRTSTDTTDATTPPDCDYLVDEYMYSDEELANMDDLVLCPRCTRVEYLTDTERMEIW